MAATAPADRSPECGGSFQTVINCSKKIVDAIQLLRTSWDVQSLGSVRAHGGKNDNERGSLCAPCRGTQRSIEPLHSGAGRPGDPVCENANLATVLN